MPKMIKRTTAKRYRSQLRAGTISDSAREALAAYDAAHSPDSDGNTESAAVDTELPEPSKTGQPVRDGVVILVAGAVMSGLQATSAYCHRVSDSPTVSEMLRAGLGDEQYAAFIAACVEDALPATLMTRPSRLLGLVVVAESVQCALTAAAISHQRQQARREAILAERVRRGEELSAEDSVDYAATQEERAGDGPR